MFNPSKDARNWGSALNEKDSMVPCLNNRRDCAMHCLQGGSLQTSSRLVPNTQAAIPWEHTKCITGCPANLKAQAVNNEKAAFWLSPVIRVDALNIITGSFITNGRLQMSHCRGNLVYSSVINELLGVDLQAAEIKLPPY